jgi:hypothetical protein
VSESLYGSGAPSGAGQFSDGAPGLTLGVVITPSVSGQVLGGRFYWGGAPVASSSYKVKMYAITSDVTGFERATKDVVSPIGTGWNDVFFDTPMDVAAGETFVMAYFTPGSYSAKAGEFATAPLVSGNLTAIQTTVPYHNGRFHVGAPADFPENSIGTSGTTYYADVLFSSGGVDTAPPGAPTGLHVASMTQSTVSLAWTAASDNVGVAGYDVYVDDLFQLTVPGTSYTVPGLLAGSLHSFKVRARDAVGNIGNASNIVSCYTESPSAVPDPASELDVQRQLTIDFIAADPTSVAFIRYPRVANGSGGYKKGAPQSIGVQAVKVVRLGDIAVERTTEDGRSVAPSFALVAEWDADLVRWDEFTMNGHRLQVVYVDNRGYEIKAEVIYLG